MANEFGNALAASVRGIFPTIAQAPLVREQARQQSGLMAAQAGKANTDAATAAYQLQLRQDPEFRRQMAAIFPGVDTIFQAGGDPDSVASNAIDLQRLGLRGAAVSAIPQQAQGLDLQNRLMSIESGSTYEPMAAIGNTGVVYDQATGAGGVADPGLRALFGEQAAAEIAAKRGQGVEYDSSRGVMVDKAQGMAQPVRTLDGAALPQSSGAFNKAYDEGRAKSMVEADEQMRRAGVQASATLGNLDRMEQLVGEYEGGLLTGPGMAVASLGNSLGITIDPNLGAKQAAESLFNGFTLKLRTAGGENAMPGAMSDSDRSFLQSMSPQLAQTAAGRRVIIQNYRAVAQREQQVAGMAAEYKRRNGGRLDDGFFERLSAWSLRNPLFGAQDGNP